MIFRSSKYTSQIQTLNPVQDHERIVYLMAKYEFPWDLNRALEIALMRTYCSPRISSLLHYTKQFEKYGQKRYDDTALLVAEFLKSGYNSPRGKRAISHMNYIHSHFSIANEDYLYVLSTFIFDPIRWIDEFGWRKTTQNEREALFHFLRQVGLQMNLQNIPETLEAFQHFVQQYEAAYFQLHKTNQKVADATVRIVKHWLPKPLRFAVFPVLNTLLDHSMRQAFNYPVPPRVLTLSIRKAMKIRAYLLKIFDFNFNPRLFNEKPSPTYPKGYEIEQLGPYHIIAKRFNK